ncbi:hypothetical protein CH76_13080 [Lysinibacillus sp. BF-4]|uniref:hypothetical protein n=1 Tax=Lysinibacillus sp. BF-4 TaxID=1473546 RepID=UPI00050585F2|nr:hypothetical protein [Lysinibacillus sp. BF-4]KFL42325.1 hypothetical protein CH76_13080 [Lysinibacillus sp. BF-4]
MLGNIETNKIDFLNFLYKEKKFVYFKHIANEQIATLYAALRQFGKDVRENYEAEEDLLELFQIIRKNLNRFLSSIDNYNLIFEQYLSSLIGYFKELRNHYTELFDMYGRPLIMTLQTIQNQSSDTNFIKQEIRKKINLERNQCIVTRYKSKTKNVDGVPVVSFSEYLRNKCDYDDAFIIGSPEFFDQRASSIFLATNTYFLTYSIFRNDIKRPEFLNHIPKNLIYDSMLSNVCMGKGLEGQSFIVDFGEVQEQEFQKEEIILRHTQQASHLNDLDKVEANLVILHNNHYTFIPVDTKVRKVNQDSLRISSEKIQALSPGDWLLFRNNTNTDLIIEVANQLLGEAYIKHRKLQKKWKKKLRKVIELNGEEKVIRYFKNKGVKNANFQNLKNWTKETSIAMKYFEELLQILKFDEKTQKEMQESAKILNQKHIQAGKSITAQLLEELDGSVVDSLVDDGYVTFTTPLIEGASFNIEMIKEIDYTSIMVDYRDVLNVWRE